MRRKRKWERLLAAILTVALIFSSLPTSALANGSSLIVGTVDEDVESGDDGQTGGQTGTETEPVTEAQTEAEPATEAMTGAEPAPEAEPEPPEDAAEPETVPGDQVVSEAAAFEETMADGVTVKLNAPEGAFNVPADEVAMTAVPLNEEQKAALEGQLAELAAARGMTMSGYVAYDISLQANGESVQPNVPVQVAFGNVAVPEGDTLVGFQAKTSTMEVTKEKNATVIDGATVAVNAKHFTVQGFYYGHSNAEETPADDGIRRNVVTFEVADGAAVTVWGENVPNEGTAMAKDGTIIFTAEPEEGYEITSVIFDRTDETRKTENENEYILAGIQTDETVISVSTQALETEETEVQETEAAETEVQETETEAKKKSNKVYVLYLSHVLNTGTIGSFQSEEEIALTEDDFADGGYDVLQNADKREGLAVITPELILTEKDFRDYGNYMAGAAIIEYGVAEGYRAERVPKNGIALMDVYTGQFDEVTFTPIEQISVKVNVYVNRVLVSTETVAKEKESGSETYSFSYAIDKAYAEYNCEEITEPFKFTNGVISAENLEKKEEAYVVDVRLQAPLVKYKIEYVDDKGTKLQDDGKGEGLVGDMTKVDPPKIDHYVVAEYEDKPIRADESTVVTIKYEPETYHVFYKTDGGSYVSPKSGKYEEEVEVYSRTEGGYKLICGKEEHEHVSPSWGQSAENHQNETIGCYTSQEQNWYGRKFWQWVVTCGKEAHTHSYGYYGYGSCYDYIDSSYVPSPTKQGYTFAGWYKDADCKEQVDQSVALKEDVTVYAK